MPDLIINFEPDFQKKKIIHILKLNKKSEASQVVDRFILSKAVN